MQNGLCSRVIPSRNARSLRALPASTSVSYSRHMVEVVRTDGFDQWLRKLKDRVGRLRIVERLDRLAAGNPGDANRLGGESGSFG